MKLILTRYSSIAGNGTIGRLEVVDGYHIWTTMEPEWRDNRPDLSCVPLGIYQLEPHNSPSHPHTWALVNEALGVSHYMKPGVPRDTVLIHSGNWASGSEGCILLGQQFAIGPDPHSLNAQKLMVTQSKMSLTQFLSLLDRNGQHTIEIVENR